MMRNYFLILFCFAISISSIRAQDHGVARKWNEIVLEAIRNDYARPTIHARNLFHTSVAMYDAWAIFDLEAEPYILGKKHSHFHSSFGGVTNLDQADLTSVMSHAVYQILLHRYASSPGFIRIKYKADSLMGALGLDIRDISLEYESGNSASLGNFLALEIINYGLRDGANEQNQHENLRYQPVNGPLNPALAYKDVLTDPNRWQPLFFNEFIDQSGNPSEEAVPAFLSPEWGDVAPFAIEKQHFVQYERDNGSYSVAFDPGAPPSLEQHTAQYQWGFTLVSHWSSHLSPDDGVVWDISPGSIGNLIDYPEKLEDYPSFYPIEGGDNSTGRTHNPVTGQAYSPQWVKRGDYTRVLAEFWADGPDSETPPGHWFSILNYVMDHPLFTRTFASEDIVLSPLEYEVKAYFALGAAMHDAAIAAWSIKGWYDYIRPISALRYMSHLGQSTDSSISNFHPHGLPLTPGLVEIIEESDENFPNPSDVGKIKLLSWKGHPYIDNPDTDLAGVGWILADNWWPYQRPSFVTPPFAGYVSGHSTYSRAAADILTFLTDSPFFPGGMGEFVAKKNKFLVFEEGPSEDVVLQWATYQDASDQCSLSRIWGGIHPPADDIPGRKIGQLVAKKIIRKAMLYFEGKEIDGITQSYGDGILIFPNPISRGETIHLEADFRFTEFALQTISGQIIFQQELTSPYMDLNTGFLNAGIYFITVSGSGGRYSQKLVIH